MNRRTFLATAGGAVSAGLAGCGGVSASLSEEEYDIGMVHNAYQPREFEASVGDRVVWGNVGSRAHTVTAYGAMIPEDAAYFASGGFDSQQAALSGWPGGGGIDPGETYAHTFETPGEHRYYCIPHEAGGMKGRVVVTE